MSSKGSNQDWNGESAQPPSLADQVVQLADAMLGSNVTELELTDGDIRVYLKRAPVYTTAVPFNQNADNQQARSIKSEPAAAEMTLAVMAPLTGVFYDAPSPASPPYVQAGDIVQPGQVVCIVEAMKVFNEIKTEIGGIVVATVPKAGQLVKKGDPLVQLKPF